MTIAHRFTSADLDSFPYIEGVRYEIIDGELLVSTQPHWGHQYTCGRIAMLLDGWGCQTRAGFAVGAPGVIFSPDNDVAPDVVWVSRDRLLGLLDAGGHLCGAPELVAEVLSPGPVNELRDRDVKLGLYSRQRVQEYWIVDWRNQTLEIYRHNGSTLKLAATLTDADTITSPLLPGFSCPLSKLWVPRV
jgi:Uma2 family endonuclease